jgi:uncharacterized protein YwgA
MNKNELTSKDLLLSLLYCPGVKGEKNDPVIGRTRLTKMIFLFEKEIKNDFFKDIYIQEFDFEPYNFGPYSKELFDDLKFFLAIGLIWTEETSIPISSAEKNEYEYGLDDGLTDEDTEESDIENHELRYFLSDNGIKYVEDNVWKLFSNKQKESLIDFKKKINTISLDSLLRYVYSNYKDYAEKSVIAERY